MQTTDKPTKNAPLWFIIALTNRAHSINSQKHRPTPLVVFQFSLAYGPRMLTALANGAVVAVLVATIIATSATATLDPDALKCNIEPLSDESRLRRDLLCKYDSDYLPVRNGGPIDVGIYFYPFNFNFVSVFLLVFGFDL